MCCVAFKVKSCNQEVEMISMAGESASKLEAVARCSTAFRYLFVIFCNISGQLLHPVCDCIVTALWLHCALWQDYVSSKTPQLLSLLREAHSGLSTPETGIECIECIAHKSVEPYFAYVQYVQFTVRLLDQGRGFKLRQTSRSKHEKFISVENTAAWPQDWGVPLAQIALKPNKLHNLFADLRHLATAGEYKHQMVAFTANHQRSKVGGCV